MRYDFVILLNPTGKAAKDYKTIGSTANRLFYSENQMIERIVRRYCLKQAELIKQLKLENTKCLRLDQDYKDSNQHHRRKRSIMIATTMHNTAIDLFLRDSELKKIQEEL